MKKLLITLFLFASFSLSAQVLPNYWSPTSGTDTYTVYIPNFGTISNKIAFVRFTNTNTGTATINVSSTGATPLKKWDGDSWEDLAAGDLDVDTDYRLSYDNTNTYFRVEGVNLGASGGIEIAQVMDSISNAIDTIGVKAGNGLTVIGDSVVMGGSIDGYTEIELNDGMVYYGTGGAIYLSNPSTNFQFIQDLGNGVSAKNTSGTDFFNLNPDGEILLGSSGNRITTSGQLEADNITLGTVYNDIGTASLTGDTNNLTPSTSNLEIRIDANGNYNLTGISVSASFFILVNIDDTNTINLIDNSGSSIQQNRFMLGDNFLLQPGEKILLHNTNGEGWYPVIPLSDGVTVTQMMDSITNAIDTLSAGGSSALSGITSATETNTIDSDNYHQIWDWNTLSSGTGLSLRSSSTGAASNTLKVLSVEKSGANSTSTQTTTALNVSNTSTGTSSTNQGIVITTTGGTNNTPLRTIGGINHIQNTGASASMVFNRTDGKSSLMVAGLNGGAFLYDNTGTMNLSPATSANILAGIGSTSATGLFLDGSGNVGAGTTTLGGKFHVRGLGTTTGYNFITENSAGTDRFAVKDNGEIEISGSAGTSGQVLTSAGTGAPPTWETSSAITGSGTANYIPYFTGSGTVGNESGFEYNPSINTLNAPTIVSSVSETGLSNKIQVVGSANVQTYEMLWRNVTSTGGAQAHSVVNGLTDATATILFTVTGIKSDGSESYGGQYAATYNLDGTTTLVQVGTTTTIYEHKTDVGATVTIDADSNLPRVAYSTGDGDSYRWSIWAKVTITTY